MIAELGTLARVKRKEIVSEALVRGESLCGDNAIPVHLEGIPHTNSY